MTSLFLIHKIWTHYKVQYLSSKKKDKRKVAKCVVDSIKSQDPPGRFLELDSQSGCWIIADEDSAIDKACQALRDKKSNEISSAEKNIKRENVSSCLEIPSHGTHVSKKKRKIAEQSIVETCTDKERLSVHGASYDDIILSTLQKYYCIMPKPSISAMDTYQSVDTNKKDTDDTKFMFCNKSVSDLKQNDYHFTNCLKEDEEFDVDTFIDIMNLDQSDIMVNASTNISIVENKEVFHGWLITSAATWMPIAN